MKILALCMMLVVFLGCSKQTNTTIENKRNNHYISNKSPLISQPYVALPLGTIKPNGMLLKMLELQRDGLTGHLDSIYSLVCGNSNGWLGGNGDGWERGPYWIDGLIPLAYLLDDQKLKDKAQKWIEWSINNQKEDGYFGPMPLPEGYTVVKGTQQDKREDWWPKMVMLKALQQYYTASGDDRVIMLMTRYFKYMQENLSEKPLGNWTYWGNRRGGDNLAVVYWLYNITEEPFLLDLAETIYEQTFEWAEVFTNGDLDNLNPTADLHCVNIAHGLKTPVVYYQQHPEEKYLNAVKSGLSSLRNIHGYVNGMFGADERLHGNDPVQGIELCTVIEMMYSFETNLPLTGDVYYADYLEKLAYNALPAQHNDDFTCRQYFQQTNQIKITRDTRNFFNNEDHRMVMGVLTGYPCCTSNMHQGWPKFVQNLWYASHDNGLAALVYGASEVKAKVAGGTEVHFTEETNYPFEDKISFHYKTSETVQFPLHLRIPSWCENASVLVNGEDMGNCSAGKIKVINRSWKKDDKVELHLPMEVKISRWQEESIGIERGPLVYALPIKGKTTKKISDDFPNPWYEVRPVDSWNYGLVLKKDIDAVQWDFKIKEQLNSMPWNEINAPVSITIKGKKLPDWKEYNHSAGKMPRSPVPVKGELEEIELIPYGCTTLRIAQFPDCKNNSKSNK